jgi:hypothetical protein
LLAGTAVTLITGLGVLGTGAQTSNAQSASPDRTASSQADDLELDVLRDTDGDETAADERAENEVTEIDEDRSDDVVEESDDRLQDEGPGNGNDGIDDLEGEDDD